MGAYLPSRQVPLLVKPPPFQWSPDDIEDPVWRAIARDMSVFCPVWFGGAECLNIIDGVDIPRATGTDVYGQGDLGFGISTTTDIECFKTTADYNPVRTSDGSGGGDFCFITYAAPLASSSNISVPIIQRHGDSRGAQADLAFNATASLAVSSGSVGFFTNNFGQTKVGVAGHVDGTLALWCARRIGSTLDIYKDHTKIATVTGTVRNVVDDGGGQQFAIGATADTTTGRFKGDLYYSGNLERAPSDDEWHHIVDNPLGIFQRRERQVYFVPAAGGGTTIDSIRTAEVEILAGVSASPAPGPLAWLAGLDAEHAAAVAHGLALAVARTLTASHAADVGVPRSMPADHAAGADADRRLAAAWTGAAVQPLHLALAWLASNDGARRAPVSWPASADAFRTLPASWAGAVVVAADRVLALDWAATVAGGHALPVTWMSPTAMTASVVTEWLAAAGVSRQSAAAWAAGVAAGGALSAAALAVTVHEGILAVEWGGATIFIVHEPVIEMPAAVTHFEVPARPMHFEVPMRKH